MKKLLIFIIIGVFLASNVLADNTVNLYLFYGQGCPHCAAEELFLEGIQDKYPTLNIEMYEVYYDNDNRILFEQCSALSGTNINAVPTTFIDRKAHLGFNDEIGAEIEAEIQRCLVEECADMMTMNDTEVCDAPIPDYNKEETIGYVILGLIGAIVLFFIIKVSFFKKKKSKKRK